MDIQEMISDANDAIEKGQSMTLVIPRPFKNRPKGFPRGEMLCDQESSNVYSYDPVKILSWLKKNGIEGGE